MGLVWRRKLFLSSVLLVASAASPLILLEGGWLCWEELTRAAGNTVRTGTWSSTAARLWSENLLSKVWQR